MPRYIDADKFIAELEQEKTVALEFEDGVAVYVIEHTMNFIGMQPTADVVPKSEVDNEIKVWQELYADTVSKWEEVYEKLEIKLEKAKAEVAREIFEEIEEALFNNHDLDLHSDYPTPHYYEELKDDIAELKKKYVVETTVVKDN